uniref:Band 7 domain-containing protein n=1 Tax=Aureoumbra lagunensis TaxID=44058 RepID=A0A7S3K4J6_9STRA
MAQSLYAKPIASTRVADDVFGNDSGLMVGLPERSGWGVLPFLIIPEGYYALVTTSGREIKHSSGSCVWPSGYHSAGPFTKVSHLVSKRAIVFDAPVKGCKTADNVTVQIDTALVFRVMGDEKYGESPELVRKFVYQVTPAGLENQLKDSLAESIRVLARSLKHTSVYACRTGRTAVEAVAADDDEQGTAEAKISDYQKRSKDVVSPLVSGEIGSGDIELVGEVGEVEVKPLDETDEADYDGAEVVKVLIDQLNKEFKEQGVEIIDVLIQNVKLPEEIARQMSGKTLVRSKQEYERMEQQYDMQDIQLKNEVEKTKLEIQEKSAKMEAEGKKAVKAASDKLNERMTVRQRELTELLSETRVQVDTVNAESKEATQKLRFEKEQALQRLRLEAEQEAASLQATADATTKKIRAETKLQIAKDLGAAKEILAQAEQKADTFLQVSREHELRRTRLNVYRKLANNGQLLVTNTENKDINMMLLADNILGSKADGSVSTHESILAELNLLRLAANAYGLRENQTYIPEHDSSGNNNDTLQNVTTTSIPTSRRPRVH